MKNYLNRLCNAISAGRFDEMKYRTRGLWYGTEIMTMPLFCSYGKIGYTVTVYGEHGQYKLAYDWELDKLTIINRPMDGCKN